MSEQEIRNTVQRLFDIEVGKATKILIGHLKTMIIIIENEGCNSFEQEAVDEAKTEVAKYDP